MQGTICKLYQMYEKTSTQKELDDRMKDLGFVDRVINWECVGGRRRQRHPRLWRIRRHDDGITVGQQLATKTCLKPTRLIDWLSVQYLLIYLNLTNTNSRLYAWMLKYAIEIVLQEAVEYLDWVKQFFTTIILCDMYK